MRLLIPLLALLLPLPATAADPRDPWEGFNRQVFAFNDWADRWVLKPVAQGYQAVTPDFVDARVSHFFANLGEVVDAVNHALQGEGRHAAEGSVRFLANSTFGLAGLFDVASAGGLPRRDTDFGITLGKWGVDSGPYLVLPFRGPTTVRDAAALPVDFAVGPLPEPWTLFPDERLRWPLEVLDVVDTRADLLRYEQVIVGDRYGFVRDVILQRRAFDVDGGSGSNGDPFLDEFLDEPVEDVPAGNMAEPPPGADATPAP